MRDPYMVAALDTHGLSADLGGYLWDERTDATSA